MSVVAIVRPADSDLREWDARVDAAEDEGIRARWEYGHALLRRRVGKQLPAGLLDEECKKTGKSRAELGHRMRFAEQYSADEVTTAVATLKSWTTVRGSLLGTRVEESEHEAPTPTSSVFIDLRPEGLADTVSAIAGLVSALGLIRGNENTPADQLQTAIHELEWIAEEVGETLRLLKEGGTK